MIARNSKYFLFLLAGTALFVAGNAAFFSITGLSHFFSGAFWSIVIMASSLELGKLVSASFLYRFWDRINKFLRVYLLVGTVTLVGITSVGIFGFLSKAYQGATLELEQSSLEVKFKEERLAQLKEDKLYLQQELEEQINTLPDNYITAKRQLRAQYTPQINETSIDIIKTTSEVGKLKQALLTTGVDVGPLLYVADAFDTSVDNVAKWLILILIFVFDPLALALVIALNVVLDESTLSKIPKVSPRKIISRGKEIEFQEEAKKNSNPSNHKRSVFSRIGNKKYT